MTSGTFALHCTHIVLLVPVLSATVPETKMNVMPGLAPTSARPAAAAMSTVRHR